MKVSQQTLHLAILCISIVVTSMISCAPNTKHDAIAAIESQPNTPESKVKFARGKVLSLESIEGIWDRVDRQIPSKLGGFGAVQMLIPRAFGQTVVTHREGELGAIVAKLAKETQREIKRQGAVPKEGGYYGNKRRTDVVAITIDYDRSDCSGFLHFSSTAVSPTEGVISFLWREEHRSEQVGVGER